MRSTVGGMGACVSCCAKCSPVCCDVRSDSQGKGKGPGLRADRLVLGGVLTVLHKNLSYLPPYLDVTR